jgi:RND family efflux transporter MFP subunit
MENIMRILLPLLVALLSLPAQAIDLNGIAEFDQRLTLNSSISARVEQVHVEIGQSVATGDLLLSLVSTGLQAHVNIASAQVDALAPNVERMLTELEKAQELYDRDSLARIALQQSQQDHSIAAAKLSAALAKLDLARFHLSQAQLRSPIDGIVLGISAFAGQYINTRVNDQTLITVADNRSMSVQALLPVEIYHKSLMNRAARVTYLQQSFRGKVVAIDRQVSMGANNHPAMFLQIKFSTDGLLPAGLPVNINVDTN